MKNWQLLRALKVRGESIEGLAAKIGSHRCHVSQVLNNIPGRGGQTRRKLAKLLTAEERALAGWDESGKVIGPGSADRIQRIDSRAAPLVCRVPRETKLQV